MGTTGSLGLMGEATTQHIYARERKTMDIYYIDGEFVEDDKAMVPAKDITVLRGYGVFDFLITYNKTVCPGIFCPGFQQCLCFFAGFSAADHQVVQLDDRDDFFV